MCDMCTGDRWAGYDDAVEVSILKSEIEELLDRISELEGRLCHDPECQIHPSPYRTHPSIITKDDPRYREE